MIPDPAPPFLVEMTGLVRDRLIALVNRAAALGITAEITPILTEIGERLRMDPRGWGDPLRDLRHMNLTFYRGYLKPFVAYYSVHARIPLVSLWRLAVEPDHPLSGDGPS